MNIRLKPIETEFIPTVIKFSYKATIAELIAFRRLPEHQFDPTRAQITNAYHDHILQTTSKHTPIEP